jgi:hypothetical protein
VSVAKVEVVPVKNSLPDSHAFKELVLEIEVSNLK